MSACTSRVLTKLNQNIKLRSYSTRPSYIHKVGKRPLQYITSGTLLENAVKRFGDRKALISKHQNKSLTFEQVLTQADKLAAGLKAIGLQKNDRVGLWAPNLAEWYVSKMACARAGIITVCLNPVHQPPELKYCINKVGIKALICGNKLRDHDYYENFLEVAPELEKSQPGKLKSIRVPSLQSVITISDEEKLGTYNYEEILNLASSTDIARIHKSQKEINPDNCSVIQFTSGTTGKPKAVVLSHFNLVNNSFYFGEDNEFSKKHHIVCAQVPFFHIFGTLGSVLTGLHHGNTTVLPSDGYSANKSFDAIQQERCTTIYGTPTMFVDLIEIQEKREKKIFPEIAVIGGAFSAPELFKQIFEILNIKKIKTLYGLTEATGQTFHSPFVEDKEKTLTTVGTVNEHLEVKVIDKKGEVVPFGTAGEVCLRGFPVMLRYWDDKEKTEEVLGDDGWLKTGDQFILEEDGYGQIVGRLKEMIIRGGENIAPKEVEEFLLTHPDILDVHVIGVPHHRLGEEVCACIRIKANRKITLEDIVDFCEGKLAYFKIPTKIRIFDEFPKTTSGKVQKFKLQEMVQL